MKVLVINGSPRGKRSNTMLVTTAFLEGMSAAEKTRVQIVDLAELNIKPCAGCFTCWTKTPGKCAVRDDVHSVMVKLFAADIIIWSFPLYFYGLPALLKAFVERQIPYSTPFMTGQSDKLINGGHPPRFSTEGQRNILISTCGFYPVSYNYDGIRGQFDMIFGKGNYDALFIGEGELFSKDIAKKRCGEMLENVRLYGSVYAGKSISAQEAEDLQKKLSANIFPPKTYAVMADSGWGGSRIEDYAQNDEEVKAQIEKERTDWPDLAAPEAIK